MTTHSEVIEQSGLEFDVELSFPKNSPIFAGHFDQMPILAGAYQLLLCKHWAERVLSKKLIVENLSKTRLTGMISPDETFQIKGKIKSNADDSGLTLSCKILKDKKRVTITTITCQEAH